MHGLKISENINKRKNSLFSSLTTTFLLVIDWSKPLDPSDIFHFLFLPFPVKIFRESSLSLSLSPLLALSNSFTTPLSLLSTTFPSLQHSKSENSFSLQNQFLFFYFQGFQRKRRDANFRYGGGTAYRSRVMLRRLRWIIAGFHHPKTLKHRLDNAEPTLWNFKPNEQKPNNLRRSNNNNKPMMEAVHEIAIYIHRFHNLDLFQQGYVSIYVCTMYAILINSLLSFIFYVVLLSK